VLASCSSAATAAGGGTSPDVVARSYFFALVSHRPAAARALACSSGWRGSRSFTFAWASYRNPKHASAKQLYGGLRPRAQRVPGAWLVSLDRETGPGSLPLFRVVQNGGRYFVCGYVKR
jgi:hypothetical protein